MKLLESELAYTLTYKDIVDIIKIMDDAACHELQIELEDLKLKIVKNNAPGSTPFLPSAVVPPPAASEPPNRESAEKPLTKSQQKTEEKPVHLEDTSNQQKKKAGEEKFDGVPILSPLAGTFYRAPEPGAKPFVEIGARVEKGQQVGIVEVMKLMNNIKAPGNGMIREIRVKNEEIIEQIADTVKVENDKNWSLYFKKWFVAMVANVFDETRCTNHACLVLAGEQGDFKTTWLESLVPNDLIEYRYTGQIKPENKDTLKQLALRLLIIIDDQLHKLNKTNQDDLKFLITLNRVSWRPVFKEFDFDAPRLASFCGSVNGKEYLFKGFPSQSNVSMLH